MFLIKIPNFCVKEQRYIIDTLVREFLGLNYLVEIHNKCVIEITRPTSLAKVSIEKLTLESTFFFKAEQDWLKPASMPVLPLKIWSPEDDGIQANLVTPSVPILYGSPGMSKRAQNIHLNLDIFGSAFFMLSRYEELVTKERDLHERFPGSASIAYKANFLDRPIVNEYLEILWECLFNLWPDLKRKEYKPYNFITCDVDWPFTPKIFSLNMAIKKAAHYIIYQKKYVAALNTIIRYIGEKVGLDLKDSNREAISWIMEVNEKVGNQVAFYFIPHNTSPQDTNESMEQLKFSTLLREIASRGHEIGIHPGYETFNNEKNFKVSVEILNKVLKKENVEQSNFGGRQHYLRWDASQTPHLWEENGLTYDSTLCYADKCGFRCGVCYEFSMYDLVNKKTFKLKQRPLIVMESTIISSNYEGLGYSDESIKRFQYFKNISHQFNGTFNLLWHNCHLSSKDKDIYSKLIQ